MDLTSFLYHTECPRALRSWATSLVGTKRGRKKSRKGSRIVVGWRWDGVSDEIVLVLAPKGYVMEKIPKRVWREM